MANTHVSPMGTGGDEAHWDFWVQDAIRRVRKSYGDTVSVYSKGKNVYKFGQNTSVGTSETTIMQLLGSETSETYVASNAITHVVCTDDSFGGAVTIEGHTISGTDLTFAAQTVTCNGQTKVALGTPLARATRIVTADATVFSTPATDRVHVIEDVAVSAGIPVTASRCHLIMDAAERQSLKAATAFSSSDYAFLTQMYADINKKTSALADIRLRLRNVADDAGFQTKLIRSLNTSGVAAFQIDFRPFFIVPKNHDIILTATASTTAVSISGGFNAVLASVVT